MKIAWRLSLLVVAGILALTALARVSEAQNAKVKPVVLTEEQARWDKQMRMGTAKVRLVTRQELYVQLESNPTTGYAWQVVRQDKKQLKLLRKYFVAPKQKLLGAEGTEVFRFQALQDGSSSLQLRYSRPFDKSGKDATLLTIEVSVGQKSQPSENSEKK